MKHSKLAFLFGLVLMISLLSSIPLVYNGHGTQDDLREPDIGVTYTVSYFEHSTIQITNDTDFIIQAASEAWPGNGSESDPYYIQGWNISSDATCIDIRDVSLYFIIQDCFLNTSTGVRAPGIYLDNATHASILETVIIERDAGIFAISCHGLIISGCNISASSLNGISLQDSYNCFIDSCIVNGTTGGRGVLSNHCRYLVVSGCDIHDNNAEGIYITISDYCNVTESSIYNNGATGIVLDSSDDCSLRVNDIFNNSNHGIDGYLSEFCFIHDNNIWENGWYPAPSGGCGIYTYNLYNVIVDGWVIDANTIWNNSLSGIRIVWTEFFVINDNLIYDNSDDGIFGDRSELLEVSENNIWDNGWKRPPWPEAGQRAHRFFGARRPCGVPEHKNQRAEMSRMKSSSR